MASQVPHLVRAVNKLNQDLIKARQDFSTEDDKLRREIAQIERNLQRVDQEIRDLIAAAEYQDARFNARGLPLIGLSVPMTGPANILAENGAVAWSFIGLAVISVIFAVWPWGVRLLQLVRGAPGAALG